MAVQRMMQGDSYAVDISLILTETNAVVTPNMVSEIEICVGEAIRKTYSAGEVQYDAINMKWYFIPSQEETLAMEPGGYEVQVRPKFNNGAYSTVKGIKVGQIVIFPANSKEVI